MKTAVYVVPLPEKLPIVPPDTVMSVEVNPVGVSESVNVIVSVCPEFRVPNPDREIDTVGAVVSTVTASAVVDVCVSATPSNAAVEVERNL